MTQSNKKMTIAEIARLAGVSTGTVSRALNGRSRVAEETRANVMRIVQQTGFVPDHGAQRLARGTTQMIGVASAEGALRRPYYSYLLDSIQETFVARGYVVRVIDPTEDPATDECLAFIVPGMHVDDSRPRILLEKNIPTVVVGQPFTDCGAVEVVQQTGILEAMKHLTHLGHRKIMHMGGPPSGEEPLVRLQAYRAGLEAANLPYDPELVTDGNFSDLDAYRATRRLLERGVEFTAVFASSDEMALGTIKALEDVGMRVPHDVSVVGYDDLPFSRQVTPSLSTVRQPIRDIGHAAAKILLEFLGGTPLHTVQIQTQLIVRGSSGVVREE